MATKGLEEQAEEPEREGRRLAGTALKNGLRRLEHLEPDVWWELEASPYPLR